MHPAALLRAQDLSLSVCVGIFFRSSPNKETHSGVLGHLRAVAVPLGPISGGKETLGPATYLLGQVCVSFFGENQKIPPHSKKHTEKRMRRRKIPPHKQKNTPALGKVCGSGREWRLPVDEGAQVIWAEVFLGGVLKLLGSYLHDAVTEFLTVPVAAVVKPALSHAQCHVLKTIT